MQRFFLYPESVIAGWKLCKHNTLQTQHPKGGSNYVIR